jgi:hypothetical protein
MGRIFAGKCFFYAAVSYLALAIAGMSAFISFDVSYIENLAGKTTNENILLPVVTNPAEGLAIISASKTHPFSPLRHGGLRMVMPGNTLTAGTAFLYAAVRLIPRTTANNIKNTILLKLRI